jgi:hypothetical protein
MQFNGDIQGARERPTQAALPTPTPMPSRSNYLGGKQDYQCGFFGVGLPHLGVEVLIAMANKLLMHYGCRTATGQFMLTLCSFLYIELGLSFQPL